jgi:hypothetical protein
MKKMFLTLLVTLATVTASATPQEVIVEVPQCKVTLATVIDALTEYDILHQTIIADGRYWGMTIPARKIILISNEPSQPVRRETVIHEMCHAYYRTIGLDIPGPIEEQFVQQQTAEIFKEIFGK